MLASIASNNSGEFPRHNSVGVLPFDIISRWGKGEASGGRLGADAAT